MRSSYNVHWTEALPQVTENINGTWNNTVQNYPNQINDPIFDPQVRNARKVVEAKRASETAKSSSTFKVGDFVYADFLEDTLYKAFDVSRGMILKISSIDSSKHPNLYTLEEINHRILPGKYYASELKECI
jgi:hypothetical protein